MPATHIHNTIQGANGEYYRARVMVDDSGNPIGVPANPIATTAAASPGSTDAFSRNRVSQPHMIYDALFTYGQQTHLYDIANVVGTGTVTDVPTESAVRLSVGAVAGDMVTHYSSQRIYYQPGRSQLIFMTGNFEGHVPGVEKRIGIFDNEDGLMFKSDGTQMNVTVRSSVTGAVVETDVPQAAWNIDKLDGTGPSGITIDWTQAQIFVIDFQWLGVGRVRFGLDINGDIVYVHEVLNANNITTVYMSQPHLYLGYEVKNVAGTNPGTLLQICSAAFSEGGYENRGYLRSISSGTTPVTVQAGVLTPVLSIRPSALFNGKTNKGKMTVVDMDIMPTGAVPVHWEIIEDGVLTAPTWTPRDPAISIAEYDVAATAITGGRAIHEGYSPSNKNKGAVFSEQMIDYIMSIHANGHVDTITIAAMGIGGTAPCYAQLSWRERL